MAAIGRVLPSPQRFCIVEASANEWSFNAAPVPWILPESYHNPNETVLDNNDNDNGDDEAVEGSLGKGSGSVSPTGPTVTTGDGVEEGESNGFETVDDGEEAPSTKVVIRIPAKEVAKPEGSSLTGKDLLFESDEEDKLKVKKQIVAALDTTGSLGDLMLSEDESGSESESSDDDDDNDEDLNETKQYHQGQEDDGIGKSESKPSNPTATVTTNPPAVPDSSGNPNGSNLDAPSKNTLPAKPAATKGKGPNSENSSKAPAPKLQLSTAAQLVQERTQSALFGVATLAQATGMEEDTICHLENYTGLLTGLQKLVVTMASGYGRHSDPS